MLDKKINALLYTHDCVIVPGLGGFVASQVAARHNAVQHTFIPPARVIAFNVFLRQNDGLLANFISGEEKISFSDSMKIIERYVERCFMELEAGRKVTVADIGLLYYDTEKNIQFSPDETALHSLDAFGLAAFRAVPVVPGTKKENIFFSPLRESAKKEKKRQAERNRKTARIPGSRLVNAGLVVGVLLWAIFNVYIIAPRNFNLSALNPFEKTASPRVRLVQPPEPSKQEETSPKNISSAAPAALPSNNKAITPVAEEKIHAENITEKRKEGTIPVAPPKENAEASGNYFTVVGVFSVPSNAEKMLAKLRDSGYQNAGSIERENKPTMVFAAQHLQRADALQSLQHLKEQGIDAWIFAR
jgi:hypothetical protein